MSRYANLQRARSRSIRERRRRSRRHRASARLRLEALETQPLAYRRRLPFRGTGCRFGACRQRTTAEGLGHLSPTPRITARLIVSSGIGAWSLWDRRFYRPSFRTMPMQARSASRRDSLRASAGPRALIILTCRAMSPALTGARASNEKFVPQLCPVAANLRDRCAHREENSARPKPDGRTSRM